MSQPSAPSRGNAALMAVSIATTGIVVVAVNFLIYHAKVMFGYYQPDYVAVHPATISRGISEPAIGEPFADWMAISAPLLFVGVTALVLAEWRELYATNEGKSRPVDRGILFLCILVVALQGLASVGMVILSHFRFPDNNDMHMVGSYIFFFSQAFVVVFGEVLSRRAGGISETLCLPAKGMVRVRKIYVWIPIVLGVSYLSLFVLKDFDLGGLNDPLYVLYTLTEPMLITSFLGYVLTYHVDMWLAIRLYRRS